MVAIQLPCASRVLAPKQTCDAVGFIVDVDARACNVKPIIERARAPECRMLAHVSDGWSVGRWRHVINLLNEFSNGTYLYHACTRCGQ